MNCAIILNKLGDFAPIKVVGIYQSIKKMIVKGSTMLRI